MVKVTGKQCQEHKPELAALIRGGASQKLVEDVVGALRRADRHNSGALQKVGGDCGPGDPAPSIEGDLCELAKTGGVVVP